MTRAGGALLFLSSDFPPQSGGMARYSQCLTRSLTGYFEKVIVVVARGHASGEGNAEGDIELQEVSVGENYLLNVLKLFFHVLKITKREKISCVMASVWSPCGVVAWLLSFVTGLKYYVGAYGLDILEPLRSRKFKFLMKRTLKRADKIFPISEFTKKRIDELGVDHRNTIVIPPGVDLKMFENVENAEEILDRHNLRGKTVLLTVGRLVRRKGHDLVVEAMKVLAKRYDNLTYVIVGEGPEKDSLEAQVRSHSLMDKIIFAGFVSEEEVPKYYQICDIFVMPVRELTHQGDVEGFGIVFLEANACGKPVIGSRSGGVEDAVLDNGTGILIDPENREQLIEAISKLLENKELALELGRRGKERVHTELTWENSAAKIVHQMSQQWC